MDANYSLKWYLAIISASSHSRDIIICQNLHFLGKKNPVRIFEFQKLYFFNAKMQNSRWPPQNLHFFHIFDPTSIFFVSINPNTHQDPP